METIIVGNVASCGAKCFVLLLLVTKQNSIYNANFRKTNRGRMGESHHWFRSSPKIFVKFTAWSLEMIRIRSVPKYLLYKDVFATLTLQPGSTACNPKRVLTSCCYFVRVDKAKDTTVCAFSFQPSQFHAFLFLLPPFACWWFRIVNTFQPEQAMWNLIYGGTISDFHLKCMPSCYRMLSLNASLLPAFEVVFQRLVSLFAFIVCL